MVDLDANKPSRTKLSARGRDHYVVNAFAAYSNGAAFDSTRLRAPIQSGGRSVSIGHFEKTAGETRCRVSSTKKSGCRASVSSRCRQVYEWSCAKLTAKGMDLETLLDPVAV